jgi:hypothetical protein
MTEIVAIHQGAQFRPAGVLADCGKSSPSLEAGSGRIWDKDRVQVIEGPKRVVTELIGRLKQFHELRPFIALLSA